VYYPVRCKDFSYFSVVLAQIVDIVHYITLEILNVSDVSFSSVLR
jgi:hypothetical protein